MDLIDSEDSYVDPMNVDDLPTDLPADTGAEVESVEIKQWMLRAR